MLLIFLFIFVCYVVAWRVEVEFLKYELTDAEASYTSLNQWAAIYNPKTPYSFFDYLNFYKRKWLFKYIIIDPNIDAIEEGWINSYTFLMFLALLSFYMCSYRFDPWYVNFVAKYFHPFTNFLKLEEMLGEVILFIQLFDFEIDGYFILITFMKIVNLYNQFYEEFHMPLRKWKI